MVSVRYWLFLLIALAAGPAAAQIPADVSMGFTFSAAMPTVAGEVTEHLNGRLAVVGGAYWGSRPAASIVGFYAAPRLYTEPPGRLRPFGELALGFSQSSKPAHVLVHALAFTPALGAEATVGRRTRFRISAGYGLTLGGMGGGRGFNVTTALVVIQGSRGER